ncbi:MAG: hypothetical protein ACFFDT_01875 [Candidatus Hodarchaeota archaeon]
MERRPWKEFFLFIILFLLIINTCQGKTCDSFSSEPSYPFEPTYHYLDVSVGDERGYNVTLVEKLSSNGSIVDEMQLATLVLTRIKKGQVFLVRISEITESSFSYELWTKDENGSNVLLRTWEFQPRYLIHFPVHFFLITTNRSLLEEALKCRHDTYELNNTHLIVSRNITYSNFRFMYEVWYYEMSTGWLISFYGIQWNKTHLLAKYSIEWDKYEHKQSNLPALPSTTNIPFFLGIIIIVIYLRRKGN